MRIAIRVFFLKKWRTFKLSISFLAHQAHFEKIVKVGGPEGLNFAWYHRNQWTFADFLIYQPQLFRKFGRFFFVISNGLPKINFHCIFKLQSLKTRWNFLQSIFVFWSPKSSITTRGCFLALNAIKSSSSYNMLLVVSSMSLGVYSFWIFNHPARLDFSPLRNKF